MDGMNIDNIKPPTGSSDFFDGHGLIVLDSSRRGESCQPNVDCNRMDSQSVAIDDVDHDALWLP